MTFIKNMNTLYYQVEQVYKYQTIRSNKQDEHLMNFFYYKNKITNEKLYTSDFPIQVAFHEGYDDARIADIHFCNVSQTFGTNNIFFVSGKVKKILELFHLPLHKFYPSELFYFSENRGQKRSDYYLFHFLHNYLQEIDFSKSQFGLVWFGKFNNETYLYEKFLEVLEEGEIRNLEEYWTKIDETKRIGNHPNLFPVKLAYKKHYDVLEERNFSYFSEKLKEILEENGVTGIKFRTPQIDTQFDASLDDIMFIPEITIL